MKYSRLLVLIWTCFVASVFAQDVVYINHLNGEDIDGRTLSSGLPVGRTPGTHGVSATGGAQYAISLPLPPGSNGMVPSLGIGYNSQGGDGHLGLGWSLSGLSAITRGPDNIYFEGKVNEAGLDSDDALYFEGQRLISTSSAPGTATYVKEMDDLGTVITAHQTSITGPAWFTVTYKSGLTVEYGNGNNSSFNHTNGTPIIWAINKVRECNGNYIEYVYESGSDDHRISEIRYTGNDISNATPYNTIEFNYGVRADRNTSFIKGFPVQQKFLLEEIIVTVESSQQFKRYTLDYSEFEHQSFLSKITEYGSANTALNATLFKYGDDPVKATVGTISAGQGVTKDFITGDFNGDGKDDFILGLFTVDDHGDNDPTNDTKIYASATLFLGNSNYGFNQGIGIPLNLETEFFDNGNLLPTYAMDANGDGSEDFITAQTHFHHTGNYHIVSHIKTWKPNYAGTSISSTTALPPTGYNKLPHDRNWLYPGDFDGDGRVDYLTLLIGQNNTKAHISLQGGADPNHEIQISPSAWLPGTPEYRWAHSDGNYIIDFNGDGKSDLMVVDELETRIYTFEKQGNDFVATEVYKSNFPTKHHTIYVGDFNGDGQSDLLTYQGLNWFMHYSTGVTFAQGAYTPAWNLDPQSNDNHIIVADFNGDGESDIFNGVNGANGLSGSAVRIHYRDDLSFTSELVFGAGNGPDFGSTAVGDFNGDGRADILNEDNINHPMDFIHFNRSGTERLLEAVSDGYNYVTEFSYKPLTEGGSFYDKGAASIYPLTTVQPSMWVTDEVTIPDGIGGTNHTYYRYEGLKLHREGKGIMGFSAVETTNDIDVFTQRTEYTTNETFFVHFPTYSSQRYTSNNTPVTEMITTMGPLPYAGNRFILRPYYMQEWDYVIGAQTRVDYAYDANNNITQQTTQVGLPLNGVGNAQETETITYADFEESCTGFEALPKTVTKDRTRDGQIQVTEVTKNSFSTITGLISRTSFWGSQAPVTTDFLNPDTYGNYQKIVISAPGVQTKEQNIAFDSKGRYPVAQENVLQQTATSVMSPLWGTPLSVISIEGLTMAFVYDEFGRLIQEVDKLGNTKTINYAWMLGGGSGTGTTTVDNALYQKTMTKPGSPSMYEFYDIYERVRESGKTGLNNQVIREVTSYFDYGLVKTTTTPFINAIDAEIFITQRDDHYRITTKNNGAVGTESYSYNGGNGAMVVTQTTAAGQVSSTKTDAAGRVIYTNDGGGGLTYTYDSWGNELTVSNSSTTLTTTGYDPLGRRSSFQDENTGTMPLAYTYDAYGRLKTQSDANGNTRVFNYDVMDRLSYEYGPDGQTDYIYVTSGNGLNQLSFVVAPNTITNTYTYDNYHRISSFSSAVPGIVSCTYQYNSFGNLKRKTYGSGVDILYDYDASGYPIKITSVENSGQQSTLTDLWIANDMNAFGQYTNFDMGNGQNSSYTYNKFGMPTTLHSGMVNSVALDWNLSSGNLTARHDGVFGLSENFTYDNMDRLASTQLMGFSPVIYDYQSNGNMEEIGSNGEAVYYANANIHGMRMVGNDNFEIPLDLQEVTYNGFDQPATIEEGSYHADFTYGPNFSRRMTQVQNNGVLDHVRAYFAEIDYEFYNDLTNDRMYHIHYVPVPDYAGVMLVQITNQAGDPIDGEGNVDKGGSLQTQKYYYYTDHLGSIQAVTDDAANVEQHMSFDAWGRRRSPATWQSSGFNFIPALPWLTRGYTGHEHFDQFDLVHMNGRLYDPQNGRMFSPDNFVHPGAGTQGYNRYSYALNNPLKFRDPTGEEPITIIAGIIIGAYIGGTLANDHMNPFEGHWDFSNRNTWIGIGVGAAVGAFGGAALSAAGTKGGAVILGKKVTAAAGKKFFGSTVAGAFNVISEYEGEEDFGWNTVGDFAAGFGGAYVGLSGAATGFAQGALTFNAGGFFNVINNMMQDGVHEDGYYLVQDWVGGGMSSLAGLKYGLGKSAVKGGAKKSVIEKLGKSFGKYASQSAAWDFALTKKTDFMKRNVGDFAALYAVSGGAGILSDFLYVQVPGGKGWADIASKGTRTGMIKAGELLWSSQFKGKPGKPKPQPNKAGITGAKWFLDLVVF